MSGLKFNIKSHIMAQAQGTTVNKGLCQYGYFQWLILPILDYQY